MLTQENISRLVDLACVACQKGLVADVRVILDGVLAERPGFVPARIALAFSHVVTDDFAGAEEILNGVLSENPDDADALAIQALGRFLSGDRDGAAAIFARIPADLPGAEMGRTLLAAR